MAIEDDIAINFAIQRAWRDTAEWGPALYNPVWDYVGSEFRMIKLKRLEPWSFSTVGSVTTYIQNKILPGILVNDKTGLVEYWQTDTKGRVSQLKNVEMLTDPIKSGLWGRPVYRSHLSVCQDAHPLVDAADAEGQPVPAAGVSGSSRSRTRPGTTRNLRRTS